MNRWTLTFRSEGDGPPIEIRVRRLLKMALRTCRLRCIDVKTAGPHETNGDEQTTQKPDIGHDPRDNRGQSVKDGNNERA